VGWLMFEKGVGDCKLKLVAKVQKTLTINIDFSRAEHSYDIFPGRKVVTYANIKITLIDYILSNFELCKYIFYSMHLNSVMKPLG